MKKNFVKLGKLALVAMSAVAFMNCGDNVTDAVANAAGNLTSSSSIVEEPVPGEGELTSSASEVPGEAVNGGESGTTGGEENGVGSSDSGTPSVPGEEVNPGLESSASEGAGEVPGETPSDPVENISSSASDDSPVASVSSSSEAAVVSSSSEAIQEAPKGIFLSTDTDENKEYMEVEYIEHTGPDGGAILSYPKRLSDTQKHGIVIWGPGGGTEPGAYGGMIHRLASHGFVVIALSSSPGDASKAIPALNWLEEKSKDASGPLYNKLDFTKVGASGHSMGGLESEEVLIKDSRVITAVMNNSGNLGGGAAQYVPTGKSIALVYGEVGSEAPNAERDYATNVKVPACLIKMEGNNFGHGSGPWDGIGATVSWMRWHLGGEDFRKADFVGTSGKYINGSVPGTPGHYNGQCKNF